MAIALRTSKLRFGPRVFVPPPPPPPSVDATIIIDPVNGNDAYTYDQVTGDPSIYRWATLGRAVWGVSVRPQNDADLALTSEQAAKPGDVVLVHSGIHNYSVPWTGQLLYKTANSGTESAPITFIASGTVALTHSGGGGLRAVIGAYNNDYIIWVGFSINTASFYFVGDKGPCLMEASTGSAVERIAVSGTDRSVEGSDNWSGVRMQMASACAARDCSIHGFRRGGSHAYGVITYDSQDCIIENNDIYDCEGGVILKGQQSRLQTDNVIRRNHLHGLSYAGVVLFGASAGSVYQNLITDVDRFGIFMLTYNDFGVAGVSEFMVANNTLVRIDAQGANSGAAFAFKTGTSVPTEFFGNQFPNNIVYLCPTVVRSIDGMIPTSEFSDGVSLLWRHNNYFGYTTVASIPLGNLDFVSWQSLGQDSHAVETLISDPQFNASSSLGAKLSAGSPAIDAGLDVLNLRGAGTSGPVNMGCYALINQSDEIGPRLS